MSVQNELPTATEANIFFICSDPFAKLKYFVMHYSRIFVWFVCFKNHRGQNLRDLFEISSSVTEDRDREKGRRSDTH